MYEQQLEGLGLTSGEIKVYLALLKLGETTTGKIIKESELSSGKIYEILDKLINKGLVAFIIKEKTKYFSATNPNKLLEYANNLKKEIEKKEKAVEAIIPDLTKMHDFVKKAYSTTIYNGIEGIKTAMFDSLSELTEQDEILSIGTSFERDKIIANMWKQFERIRVNKKVTSKYLVTDKDSIKIFKKQKYTKAKMLNIAKTTPITIMKDYVFIHNWENNSIIKIQSESISNSFKEFFNSLWEISK